VRARVSIQYTKPGLSSVHPEYYAGIAYCSTEHQVMDWSSSHKAECRMSKAMKSNKIPAFQRVDLSNLSSPLSSVILPLQWHYKPSQNDNDKAKGYTNFDNPMDRIKPASKSSTKSQCPRTIYGPGERFLVRARWGGHSPVTGEQRRTGWEGVVDPAHQEILNFTMRFCSVEIPS